MVAAGAYCLATYTINNSLWVSLAFYLLMTFFIQWEISKNYKNVTFNFTVFILFSLVP